MYKVKQILKSVYFLFLMIFARPKFQKFNEILFRAIVGSLGFMNFSEDFSLTGEKRLLKRINKYSINVAIDIGANEGQWASLFLSHSKGVVFSIEPGSLAFTKLISNASPFQDRHFCFNFAIGDKDTRKRIYVHQQVSALSFMNKDLMSLPLLTNKNYRIEYANQLTLDSFMDLHLGDITEVDFLKIDTEGSEMDVLVGGTRFVKKLKPKFIQIEMNWHQLFTGHSLFHFSKILFDYEVYQLLPFGSGLYKIDSRSPLRNFFQLSNFLFIRKDFLRSLPSGGL